MICPSFNVVMLALFESQRTSLLFPDDDPRVEISDNTEHGAWQTELR